MPDAESIRKHFEHLRRVHFGLLVTCVGLLVANAYGRPADVERALRDLGRIDSLVSRWAADESVVLRSSGTANGSTTKPDVTTDFVTWLPREHFDPPRGNCAIVVAGALRCRESELVVDAFAVPAVDVRVAEGSDVTAPSLASNPPATLEEFASLWDATLWVSEARPEIVAIECDGTRSVEMGTTSEQRFEKAMILSEDCVSVDWADLGDNERAKWYLRGREHNSLTYLRGPYYTDASAYRMTTMLGLPRPPSQRQAEFQNVVAPYRLAHLANHHLGMSLPEHAFARAFSDLALLTSDYRELELDKISSILRSERERRGSPVKVLGIELPAAGLTLWGPIVILGLQGYFLLHIRSAPSPLGHDVRTAWLGLYADSAARAALFATVVALPIGTVGCVTYLAWARHLDMGLRISSIALAAACVSVASMTWAPLARLSRERPLKDDVAP